MAIITRLYTKGCGGICRLQKAWALQFIAAGPRIGRSAKAPRVRRAQLAFGDSGSAGEFPLQDESEAPAPLNTRQVEPLELGAREKTAARKIFLLKMALDAQPVFYTLHQDNRMH
jgi:hypothetical protein